MAPDLALDARVLGASPLPKPAEPTQNSETPTRWLGRTSSSFVTRTSVAFSNSASASGVALEVIFDQGHESRPVIVEAVFDEYNLDISLTYEGEPIELSDKRPSDQEIRESEVGASKLAGYLIRRNADRVNVIHTAARATVKLHFEH